MELPKDCLVIVKSTLLLVIDKTNWISFVINVDRYKCCIIRCHLQLLINSSLYLVVVPSKITYVYGN